MSNPALSWAYGLRLGKRNGAAKAVLACLADMAGPDGGCWARQDTLADRLGIPDRTLRKALALLQAGKVLTVERGQRGCRYVLAVGAQWVPPPEPEPEAKRQPNGAADRHPVPINGHRRSAAAESQIGTPGLSDRHPVPIRSAHGATHSIDEPNLTQLNPKPPYPPEGGGAASFDDFISLYPRPGGRHDAERAWRRAVRAGTDPEDILGGLTLALDDGLLDPRERGRYAPSAAKWLRGKCWNDCLQLPPHLAAMVAGPARH